MAALPARAAYLTAKGKTCLIVRMRESSERVDAGGISDTAAVERTLAGERDAYRVLVERHSTYVYRVAYRMTGNPHDAEEIVQEAFLRAYQKLQQFAGNANFGTWVYRIAANYAIDRLRQKKNEESRREAPTRSAESETEIDPLSQVKDSAPSPERLTSSVELATKMKEALDALSPAERTAIVMRHWDGCGIEEIAAVLKSNTSAAKNTVFRAVQKLRQALKPFAEGRGTAKAVGTES
jgi:RNA polymerase sigma-70 factor, ECF subfamily